MMIGQQFDNYVETNLFGNTYKDRTKGTGDLILSGMTPLYIGGALMVLADVGVSLPTGSINNKTASGGNFAYNMQNGSGTYDAITGITVLDISAVSVGLSPDRHFSHWFEFEQLSLG